VSGYLLTLNFRLLVTALIDISPTIEACAKLEAVFWLPDVFPAAFE